MSDDLISAEQARALWTYWTVPYSGEAYEQRRRDSKVLHAPDLSRTVIAQAAEITRLRAQVKAANNVIRTYQATYQQAKEGGE